MNPTGVSTGIYAPPYGAVRKARLKAPNPPPRLHRSHSINEENLYRKIFEWRRPEGRPGSRRSHAHRLSPLNINANPEELAKQLHSLTLQSSESMRDCSAPEKMAKKRGKYVISDLNPNNLARHDEKFHRPLTGREKQRRISMWVHSVERHRVMHAAGSGGVFSPNDSSTTSGTTTTSTDASHGTLSAAAASPSKIPRPPPINNHGHGHGHTHSHLQRSESAPRRASRQSLIDRSMEAR